MDLIIRAFNAEYAALISQHMKEGFVASEDGLEMQTSVYVQDPKVFRECMDWKYKDIEKQWKSFYDMTLETFNTPMQLQSVTTVFIDSSTTTFELMFRSFGSLLLGFLRQDWLRLESARLRIINHG